MVADGEYTAVLDRVEDGERDRLAVLLLEREGRQVDELVVPVADLPDDAGQDAVLSVTVADGELADAAFRPDETDARAASTRARFDRLASRPPDDAGSDDGSDDGEPGDDDSAAGESRDDESGDDDSAADEFRDDESEDDDSAAGESRADGSGGRESAD